MSFEAPTTAAGTLSAPFPYFGGKSGACETVWAAFGTVQNYVEPFFGSGAMLLGAPDGKRVETVNDFDGMVANFWRAIAADPEAVAHHADWQCNEIDLFARHSWLVRQIDALRSNLEAAPDFYDAKIAGWWCWGACNWIGSGWCAGDGPWVHDGDKMVKRSGEGGVCRQLPHLSNAGQGINRKLPHLGDAGQGINRTTVAENPLPLRQWLQHALEEALDQAVYLQRAIEELERQEPLHFMKENNERSRPRTFGNGG